MPVAISSRPSTSRRAGLARLGVRAGRAARRRTRRADRHVDVEDPAPAERSGGSARRSSDPGSARASSARRRCSSRGPCAAARRPAAMIIWPTGMIMPPPTPCSTRNSDQLVVVRPRAAQRRAGREEHQRGHVDPLGAEPPRRPAGHGITAASDSSSPVITHWISEIGLCRSRPSVSQRDVDDRRVEDRHDRPEDHDAATRQTCASMRSDTAGPRAGELDEAEDIWYRKVRYQSFPCQGFAHESRGAAAPRVVSQRSGPSRPRRGLPKTFSIPRQRATSGSGRRPCWPGPCGRCRPCACRPRPAGTGVHQLVGEALGHRLLAALASELDQPAHGQRAGSAGGTSTGTW